jgi:hypothetical protein
MSEALLADHRAKGKVWPRPCVTRVAQTDAARAAMSEAAHSGGDKTRPECDFSNISPVALNVQIGAGTSPQRTLPVAYRNEAISCPGARAATCLPLLPQFCHIFVPRITWIWWGPNLVSSRFNGMAPHPNLPTWLTRPAVFGALFVLALAIANVPSDHSGKAGSFTCATLTNDPGVNTMLCRLSPARIWRTPVVELLHWPGAR